MYQIDLINKVFYCSENETIIEGAKKAGIILGHSCLLGRCSSCKVKVITGSSDAKYLEVGLDVKERESGYILSCVRMPTSNMAINAEDLFEYNISDSITLPAKINNIEFLTNDIVRIDLRLPPAQLLKFISGQYINVIKGDIKRSYSIGNKLNNNNILELYIKKYQEGILSKYWFTEAKVNDLLRIEGPKGTFFIRNNVDTKNLVFLATGTGIAPVKSILESLSENRQYYTSKKIYLFWGVRYYKDLFWTPKLTGLDINFIPVLSRESHEKCKMGYVQDILLDKKINLRESEIYACGSDLMIKDAKNKLFENGLSESNFYSDAFLNTNELI